MKDWGSEGTPPFSFNLGTTWKLAEALRYKHEGRGFHSRWCHWNFSLT
jgi:hypothetical protein